MTKKQITSTIIVSIIILAVIVTLVLNTQKPNEQNIVNTETEEIVDIQDLLSSDVDTSDWITYKSDKYGYSLKLPPEFIFVDEYYGKEIGYDPDETFFVISDRSDKSNTFPSFGFTVEQISIEDYMARYNKESRYKDNIVKLFSKDGIDYYDRKSDTDYPLPRILYHNSLKISLGGSINTEILKAIISSLDFNDNKEIVDYCSMEPTIGTDSLEGILLHPINPKYNRAGWMARLFTEDDCGGDKIDKLFEIRDGKFWPGVRMKLKSAPSEVFFETLESVGFVAGDSCQGAIERECTLWVLYDEVSVQNILRVKPFLDEIEYAECVNCG